MKAIKAKGTVQPDHSVRLQLPGDIAPGEHVFILVLEDQSDPEVAETAWPSGFLAGFAGALSDTDLQAPDDSLPEPIEPF